MLRRVIKIWTILFVPYLLVRASRLISDPEPTPQPLRHWTPGEVHLFNQTPITGRGDPQDWVSFQRPKMYGGRKADITNYPFTVFILRNGLQVGIGALVSKWYVLTTAYNAMYSDWVSLKVRAGSNSPFVWGAIRRVARRYVYPKYNRTWEHNIAMLLLRKPVIQSKLINYITLARVVPPYHCRSKVIGVGYNNLNWVTLLEKVNVNIVTYQSCKIMYNNPASDFKYRSFCIANTTKCPCYWNFGALAITPNKKLVGLYLGTHECDKGYEFGAFIQVHYYKRWIQHFLDSSIESIESNEIDLFDKAMDKLTKNDYGYY